MLRFLFCLLGLLIAGQTLAVTATTTPEASTSQITLNDIRDLKNKELREKLGRRLTLKEAVAFSLIRGKLKRTDRRAARGKSTPSGALAIVALSSSLGGIILAALAAFLLSGGLGGVVAALALLLAIILGAIGMRKYRGKDIKKHRISKAAFWIGLIIILAVFIIGAIIGLGGGLAIKP